MDLRGPLNDVKLLKNGLISYYGFPGNNIKILTNKKASRKNIERVFRQWLVKGSRKGDIVVFYFSGHGSTVKDYNKDEDEEDGLDEALLPYDMVPEGGANIILDDELGAWLNMLKGRHVVVIADCCYSGGAVRSIGKRTVSILEKTTSCIPRLIPITYYKPPTAARSIPKGIDVPGHVIFMAAAQENQAALERDFPRGVGFHGAFTFAICEAMKRLRKPSNKNVFDYASKVVTDRLKLFQVPQVLASESMINKPFLMTTPLLPDTRDYRPTAPPEVSVEKVLLTVDRFRGSTIKEMIIFKQNLSRLPLVELVDNNSFFDRIICGEKKNGKYFTRLINLIGDKESVNPADSIKELVNQLKQNLEYAYMVKKLARIYNPSPSFNVKVWVTDDSRRDFYLGEKIVFGIETDRDCYILLLNLDSKGNFHILFPNKHHQYNFVKANSLVLIPDKAMSTKDFQLEFGPPAGEETVKVIATIKPLGFNDLGMDSFKETFKTLSGSTAAIFVRGLIIELSKKEFEWSEDTVVIRSHKREQK